MEIRSVRFLKRFFVWWGENRWWAACGALVLATGFFLRIYQLGDQIVGDDEWHAVVSAANYPYFYIVSHFQHADNCIPLTIIYKIILGLYRLNESTLHAIPLICGTLMMIVFPLLAWKPCGRDVATVFGFLLATSPFLVYYSRFARPYIIVSLFGAWCIVWFYEWITTGNRSRLALYVGGAVVCSYFSPVSAPSLLAPVLYGFTCALLKRSGHSTRWSFPEVSMQELLIGGCAVSAGIVAWLLPAVGSLGALANKAGRESVAASTLSTFLGIFSGFDNLGASLATLGLAVLGGVWLFRNNKVLVHLVLIALSSQLASLFLVRPLGVQDGRVFARYVIVMLPFYLLFVAFGIMKVALPGGLHVLGEKGRVLLALLFLAGATMLFSPIPRAYATTNNFTNHSDFLFGSLSRRKDYSREKARISRFYVELAAEPGDCGVIEYPYFMWWPGNVAHYYQQIHRKRVEIGCWPPVYFLPSIPLYGVDFRNFVFLNSGESIAASGAKYLVIHKDMAWEVVYLQHIFETGEALKREELHATENPWEGHYGPNGRALAAKTVSEMRGRIGSPWYEDEWLTVFKLR